MKTTVKFFFIVAFFLTPILAHARGDVYYVTQKGTGARNGSSLVNAWSVSDFNDSANWSAIYDSNKISPGDTVYFSGTITGQAVVAGSGTSGNVITLDGWEGGTSNPVANGENVSCTLFDDNHANGNDGYRIKIYGKDHITIQDFRFKDCSNGIYVTADGTDEADYITIRRSYFYESYGGSIKFGYPSGSVHGSNYGTIGGASGDGIYVKNCGYNREPWADARHDPSGLGIFGADDFVFSYNEMEFDGYSDDGNFYWASNLIETGSQDYTQKNARLLFEHNILSGAGCEALIAPKEEGLENVIIRFNKMHTALGFVDWYRGRDISGLGIAVSGGGTSGEFCERVYIYGNEIYNCNVGIRVGKGSRDVHIWSNIISDNYVNGLKIQQVTSTCEVNCPKEIYIYNNTFANNGMDRDITPPSGDGGDQIVDDDPDITAINPFQYLTPGIYVKNNIFYNNRNAATSLYHSIYQDSYMTNAGNYVFDYNTFYKSGTDHAFYWGGSAVRNLTWMVANTDESDNNDFTDPGFSDPDGADNIYGNTDDDYTLDGTNRDNGADLSQCFQVTIQGTIYNFCYNDALDPSVTNWSTTPPTVGTTKHEDHGSWDRGAYVYTNGSGIKPPPPPNLRIIIQVPPAEPEP